MFEGVRRRLVLSYAAIIVVTLLLLGPVVYLSYNEQLDSASDATLRLAARGQAYFTLAQVKTDVTFGNNPYLKIPTALVERNNFFYLLVSIQGKVISNPASVQYKAVPDRHAVQDAVRHRYGIFSSVNTRDGEVRLYTVPVQKKGKVIWLVQAGHLLGPLNDAQQVLLVRMIAIGAIAAVAAILGGFFLTREAMHPVDRAFAAQRAFIADASHELRTPLTLMRTNAEVLLEADAVPDPEDRALVEDIVAEAGNMGRLINDLLTLARLDAGALSLLRDTVRLDEIVATSCRQMARLAERRNVSVSDAVSGPLTVIGDAGRLEQVVLILLDNAVKYNREGGTVTATLRRGSGQAILEVQDTGPGIARDELSRLFARFHRGKGVSSSTEGSGLGLSIAAGLVRAHRGRLQVRSEVGTGSTFTVTLPLAGEAAGQTQPPQKYASSSDTGTELPEASVADRA